MDINLLVLNVGNTRTAMGSFISGELRHPLRIPHADESIWPTAIAEQWAKFSNPSAVEIAAASVNPVVDKKLEPIIEHATGKKIQWVGRELELPIPVTTENPAETGVDRILNIAAAFEQMGKPCAVVDAGTAITVDVCNHQGIFLGGAIFPGVAMMLDALHDKTARLPRVQLEKPQSPIGRSTTEAIRHGIYHGVRGMVKELLENYAVELGSWPDLIATGGDADLLFGGWELVHAISPDLTLYGIALAYADHHIHNDG